MNRLEDCWEVEQENPEAAAYERELQSKMQFEARDRIELLKEKVKLTDDDDDDDIEVIYSN
jgi:hypothetical protein